MFLNNSGQTVERSSFDAGQFLMSVTMNQMVIDHSCCLHMGVYHGTSHKGKSPPLKVI